MGNSTLLPPSEFWLLRDATLLLLDRDNLENYAGIDRNGFAIDGNTIVNYLLDLMLAKENFVQELCELSNSFDTKMFTVLFGVRHKLKNLRFNRKHA